MHASKHTIVALSLLTQPGEESLAVKQSVLRPTT